MEIKLAENSDIAELARIYEEARSFMRETGNPTQCRRAYPDEATVLSDIAEKRLYKVVSGEEILGVFCFFVGNEPTYDKIYDGEWGSAAPCGVIHRVAVASSARGKGIASTAFAYAAASCPYIRIDTHRDNAPMQRALEKFGFVRRGLIYLQNGDERIAFDFLQKSIN